MTLPRLLLIDDDEISREVLSMTLEMHGFPVLTSEDGERALLELEARPTDVILMDTQMPGLSGSELISALRERSAARIIAISGSEISETIRTACDGFLLKPVEAEELAALLESSSDGAADRSFDNALNGISDPANKADAEDRHASGSDSVIDPPTLARLTAMMPAASVREIYDAVATDMEKRLVLLEKAMLAQDSAEVARIAHSVKGGSAMVGFKMATEAAGRLETSNRSETWPEELAQLRRALLELERILGGEFPT